jgi:hypothetical protein
MAGVRRRQKDTGTVVRGARRRGRRTRLVPAADGPAPRPHEGGTSAAVVVRGAKRSWVSCSAVAVGAAAETDAEWAIASGCDAIRLLPGVPVREVCGPATK